MWDRLFSLLLALVLFITILQLLRPLSFNQYVAKLRSILSVSAKPVAHFTVIFIIAFVGYGLCMYRLKGSVMKSFHSLDVALQDQLALVLGILKYSRLQTLDQESLKLAFTVFFVMNKFIMLNMFVVVINEVVASGKTKAILLEESQLGDFFWYKLSQWLNSLMCLSTEHIHQSNRNGAGMTGKKGF